MVALAEMTYCHLMEPSLLHASPSTLPTLFWLFFTCYQNKNDVIIMERFNCYCVFLFILDELHSLFIFCRSVQSWRACRCSLLHWQPVGGYKPYRESRSMECCDSALAGLFSFPQHFLQAGMSFY